MSLVRAASLAAFLLLSSTGCIFKRKPAPALPATPPPAPKSTATVKPAPPPPKIEPKTPETTPPLAVKIPDAAKPPPAKPPARRPRRVVVPAPPKPTADPGADSTVPAAPPPKLEDLLTDAQRADLTKKCDQAMQSARNILTRLAARTLPAEAVESVSRVRVFLLQAEQARDRDPQTALQLAQRADVLARDLLRSLR